ncbi:hypothetical protein LCGC14_0623080 [marine sediment metagenome]|uniref:Uncharacterized protein n=1 Tax=marine sediment metagenome TaxID=412755 RepID=A0A0F9TQP0_9ZZZZ
MAEESLTALLGVAGTVIVGLITLVGIMWRQQRRNNQDTNPDSHDNPVDLTSIHARFDRLEDTLNAVRDNSTAIRAILERRT